MTTEVTDQFDQRDLLHRRLEPLLQLLEYGAPAVPAVVDRLHQVIAGAVGMLGVDSVGLMLLDEHGVARVAGASDEFADALETAQADSGQGPGIDSLHGGYTVAVADLATAENYSQLWQRLGPSAPHAVLSCPVRASGDVIGNFNAFLQERHTWTAQQINAIETYAHVIGLALTVTAQALHAQTDFNLLRNQLAAGSHWSGGDTDRPW